MEILSLSRDVGMITMKTKNPPLDQTGGLREEELAKNPSQPKLDKLPSPDRDWNKTLPAVHESTQPWLSNLARKEDLHESFDELMDTPLDFLAFVMNRLNVDTLTPELLAGPTFKLMKGTCRQVIPFDYFINNDLAYLSGGVSRRTYATSVTKTKAADYGHIKWIEELVPNTMWSQITVNYDKYALWVISHWGRKRQQFYGFTTNRESARDVYFRRRIITVTKLQIVEWHGDFKRLRLQDIEDMLILLVQGKLTNLNVKEPYSNPRGFIYQNKDKKNKLMCVDELHKFSDGTLNDVRTALDDCLKGIRMEYLPQIIWRKSDKERAAAMIQAIDKQLKSWRIMRSLERFVGGRPYGGDLRLLQRTI
ncbi:hypothetical protein Tco_1440220 [Tanacetum coccineum]